MPKTPNRNPTLRKLADLNDELRFCQFALEELAHRVAHSADQWDLLTSEVFTDNPFASRIDVRVRRLPDFQTRNLKRTCEAYFSMSYEVLAGYLKESRALIAELHSSVLPPVTADTPPEESLFAALKGIHPVSKPTGKLDDRRLALTLSYIRFRRNALVHLAEEPAKAFKGIAKNHGHELNKTWKTVPRKLDFASLNAEITSFEEGICLVNILRSSVKEADSRIACTIRPEMAAEYELRRDVARWRGISEDQVTRKVLKRIKEDFALEVGADAVTNRLVP